MGENEALIIPSISDWFSHQASIDFPTKNQSLIIHIVVIQVFMPTVC